MLVSKVEKADFFRSVKPEEFEKLPRPSIEDLQRALERGRPQGDELPTGTCAMHVDSQVRFF